jgi:hypothetical protein
MMLTSPVTPHPQAGEWPVIEPAHVEFIYVAPRQKDDDRPFIAYFQDAQGAQVYKFECHNGAYGDETEMKFSGELQCALFPFKDTTVTAVNLLAVDTRDEQSNDWWNRGHVSSAQLRGDCLGYPEYSTTRHFRMRGLDVTLSFTDIQWSDGQDPKDPSLASFTLAVDAAPDKDARSPVAEPASGPRPPKSCYPGERPKTN